MENHELTGNNFYFAYLRYDKLIQGLESTDPEGHIILSFNDFDMISLEIFYEIESLFHD